MGPDPNKLKVFEIVFNLRGKHEVLKLGSTSSAVLVHETGGPPSSVTLTGAAQVHVPGLLTGVLHKVT